MNRKGQTEAGPLQKIMLSLLLISVVAVLSFSFISDLGVQYDAEITNSSVFNSLDRADSTLNRTQQIADTIGNIDNPIDFITAAISGSYNVLLLFTDSIPADFKILIDTISEVLGLPSIIATWIFGGIMIISVFAVIALVMKVRG